MHDWYLENLVCPVEKTGLTFRDGSLVSPGGRRYPVVDGIPVMLVGDVDQTIDAARASLKSASTEWSGAVDEDPYFIDTLNVTEDERRVAREMASRTGADDVDPVVSILVGATCGIAYRHAIGRVSRYPIPDVPACAEFSNAGPLLDIGCNWGRWSVAFGRAGISPVVGLDPCLGAVAAARRLAVRSGVNFLPVVGDARYQPFRQELFRSVFSYSVLQHFSREDVGLAVAEVHRVLAPGGRSAIQMPNRNGIRCQWHLARRGYSDGSEFDVRYWSLAQLESVFGGIGRTRYSVDCYFGLGLQPTDRDLMKGLGRAALDVSEFLKRALPTRGLPVRLADSVWVVSERG